MAGPACVPSARARDPCRQLNQCQLPPQCYRRGAGHGEANLELAPPLASKAGLVINGLFLIRLFCPSQPCSGIFGPEVSGNNKYIGKRLNSPPIA